MSANSLMIRASAGSGKTYQLACRFLALLAAGVPPDRIIALTFTRKAAGEFADRILSRLAGAARSEEESVRLAGAIRSILFGDPDSGLPAMLPPGIQPATAARPDFLQKQDFLGMLVRLVQVLDRLSLGTFDSFFTRIVRSSCQELGLGAFTVLDDALAKEEESRIFTRLFADLAADSSAKSAFLEAFKRATMGRDEARFARLLEGFIEDHHSRILDHPDPSAWGDEDRLWPHAAPWEPPADRAAFANDLKLRSADVAWGHKRWASSWDKAIDWLAETAPGAAEAPTSFLANNILPNLRDLQNGTAAIGYSGKTIVPPPDIGRAMATLAGGHLVAEIRLHLERTRGLFLLLAKYEQLRDSEVRRRGKLGFQDLSILLERADIANSGIGQTIGYRIDQRFDHWLLDEFQDTSRRQWNILSGLIRELAQNPGEARTLFVVGDPKQSVHGWRGGEPRLFDEVKSEWENGMPEWSMDQSWRSSPHVLSLVNQVFRTDGQVVSQRFPEITRGRWRFTPHIAARADLPGESLVLSIPEAPPPAPVTGSPGDASPGPHPETAFPGIDTTGIKQTSLAAALILRKYQPLAKGLGCAILLQTNDKARELANQLRILLPGIPVEVESETPMADDGPLSLALLDLFRWLHGNSDSLSGSHVSASPLAPALSSVLGASNPARQWLAARRRIARQGVLGLLEPLAAWLRGNFPLNAFQSDRLDSWLLKARQFDSIGGDTADWLQYLETWKKREHSDPGAIQIMTIHKSKGLEFDMVILPDLDGKNYDDTGKLDWLERHEPGKPDFLCLAPRKIYMQSEENLRSMLDHWSATQFLERFCVLYVALTRAKHALFALVPDAQNAPDNAADWLRAAADAAPQPGRAFDLEGMPCTTLWAAGDDSWTRRAEIPREPPAPEISPLPAPQPRPLARTPSSAKSSGETAKALNASRDRRQAMAFGTRVHEAFEAIGWLDDGPPPQPEDPAAADLLERCLAAPAIRSLLSRPSGEVELLREQSFDHIADGVWTTGIIDRLHIHRLQGRPTRAVIIDFKTDRVADIRDLAERYSGQMSAYKLAMQAALGLPDDTVECILLSTALAEILYV